MKDMTQTKPEDVRLTQDVIWKVWAKGEIFAGNDPVFWRKDACGAWIYRGDHGKRNSEYGWVIDHIKPVSEGGTDKISNLRPAHWSNAMRKADGNMECRVTAEGVHNSKPIQRVLLSLRSTLGG